MLEWEGLDSQIVERIRNRLRTLNRDPDEANGIVRRLEAVVEAIGPRFHQQINPEAGLLAAKMLEILTTLPIGSPQEMETTRSVLARIVRVTGFSPQGGRSSPAAKLRTRRRETCREWALDVLRDSGLSGPRSRLAAEIVEECERKASPNVETPKGHNSLQHLRRQRRKTS